MGGFVRSFVRMFSQPSSPIQQVIAPVAAPVAASEAAAVKDTARQTLASGGYGSSSVLTSQQGIEDEANVSKTVLGGTVQKRKKV
jgi:hypothetical protein